MRKRLNKQQILIDFKVKNHEKCIKVLLNAEADDQLNKIKCLQVPRVYQQIYYNMTFELAVCVCRSIRMSLGFIDKLIGNVCKLGTIVSSRKLHHVTESAKKNQQQQQIRAIVIKIRLIKTICTVMELVERVKI